LGREKIDRGFKEMIIVFEPAQSFLKMYKIDKSTISEEKIELKTTVEHIVSERLRKIERVEALGYLLYHGGELIKETTSLLTSANISKVEECIKFSPDNNELTFNIANYGILHFPDIPHILFCDTAFFSDLPKEASTYAVPYQLREQGIRRYGGYGLCHQWAWKQIQFLYKEPNCRLLSVYLGNFSNIAALKNGKPVETTIGFTPIEGLPSSTSCGDIDPTIIEQLYSTGMSFSDINQLLTRKSGFSGLLGKKTEITDIFKKIDHPEYSAVSEIFSYNLLKYIGALISILGGIDVIVFAGDQISKFFNLIFYICNRLEFLGLKYTKNPNSVAQLQDITAKKSKVKVVCLECNKAEILRNETMAFLKKRGG
jgi:acetate kinase